MFVLPEILTWDCKIVVKSNDNVSMEIVRELSENKSKYFQGSAK